MTEYNHDEFLDFMREKGRKPENEKERIEQEERNADLLDSKVVEDSKMPNKKGIISNNTGRDGSTVVMTEVEKKDIHSFMRGDRKRVVPAGLIDIVDGDGNKIGAALQMSDSWADAVEAGEFCGRCGDPQVTEDSAVCKPISRGGLARGCGFPRYRKM